MFFVALLYCGNSYSSCEGEWSRINSLENKTEHFIALIWQGEDIESLCEGSEFYYYKRAKLSEKTGWFKDSVKISLKMMQELGEGHDKYLEYKVMYLHSKLAVYAKKANGVGLTGRHPVKILSPEWRVAVNQLSDIVSPEQLVEMSRRFEYYGTETENKTIYWGMIERSAIRGNPSAQYKFGHKLVNQGNAERGWYLIERASEGGNPSADSWLSNKQRAVSKGRSETQFYVILLASILLVIVIGPIAGLLNRALSMIPSVASLWMYVTWNGVGAWSEVSHPVLSKIFSVDAGSFFSLYLMVSLLISVYIVCMWRKNTGRAYLAISATTYYLPFVGFFVFASLLGGLASQGAGI